MATEICLTISLGHGLEAFISNADTTGKSYIAFTMVQEHLRFYTRKKTWTKESTFIGSNTWKFSECMSWYLVDGYAFLTGKSRIVAIFLDISRHFGTIMGKTFTVRHIYFSYIS